MLKNSKYHKVIVGCSAIATASFASYVPSVTAAPQIMGSAVTVDTNLPAVRQPLLISQSNNSKGTGTNVSNTTGTNVSNTTGTNVSNTSGTKTTSGNYPGGGGYDAGTSARAGAVLGRYNTAMSNYERAAANLAAAEAAQKNASNSTVRYGREAGDLASCGCPNSDTVGSSSDTPELIAARKAEQEAAAELAKAKAEAKEFLESVQKNPSATNTASSAIW